MKAVRCIYVSPVDLSNGSNGSNTCFSRPLLSRWVTGDSQPLSHHISYEFLLIYHSLPSRRYRMWMFMAPEKTACKASWSDWLQLNSKLPFLSRITIGGDAASAISVINYNNMVSRVTNSAALHRTFNVEPLYLQHENSGLAIDYMVWAITPLRN